MWDDMSYDDTIALQLRYLDQIDFMPYIKKYKDLHEVVWAVEDDYDNSNLSNNAFLHGCIFNCCDEDVLSQYIKDRYNVNYEERVITQYIRGDLECGTK